MHFGLRQRAALFSGLLLLAACDQRGEPSAQTMPTGPLPEATCAQAAKSLAELAKSGSFEHDRKSGEATIDEAIWLALGTPGQHQLTQALAYDTACGAGATPREQQVLVRNSFGRTLADRTVPMTPDTDILFDE